MNKRNLTIAERIASVFAACCCAFISIIGVSLLMHDIQCIQNHMIGTDPKCPTEFSWASLIGNPFLLLTILFLIVLGWEAVRTKRGLARRILAWWLIIVCVFVLGNAVM